MTDEKPRREQEPSKEDLEAAFKAEFGKVAEAGISQHPGVIPQETLSQIREQTEVAVSSTSRALSEAIYPHLVDWWDAKVFPLSQSVMQQQRAVFEQVLAPADTSTPPQEVENITVEETNLLQTTLNQTQSVVTVNTSSGVDLSSLVIWRWNETDLLQFDTSTPILVGDLTASIAYRSESAEQVSPAIQFTCSTFGRGYAVWRIAPSENLVLPERFLFRVRVASHSIGPTLSEGSLYMGPFFHNNQWDVVNLFGFGILGITQGSFCIIPNAEGSGSLPAGPSGFFQRPFKATGGTPPYPEFTASYRHSIGTTIEYEVYLNSYPYPDPPFCSLTARKQGGFGIQNIETVTILSESFLRGQGTPHSTSLFEPWRGQTIKSLSWMLHNPSLLSGQQYEITDLCILKHPSDW